MAVFNLEDLQGNCEVVMFPKVLSQYSPDGILEVDKILFVKGKVDCKRELPNILCDELIEIEKASEKLAAKVYIKMIAKDVTEERIAGIRNLCASHHGKSPVYVSVKTAGGIRVCALADKKLSVKPDVEFLRKMEHIVGAENFELMRK